MSISIKDFVAKNVAKLKDITNIPKKEIELLIAHHLNLSLTQIQIYDDKILSNNQIKNLEEQIDKRASFYPFEYIVGLASFYSEEFFVEEGVLIPRPETEILIDEVLKLVKDIKKDIIKIVEIGTGSGIISTMLAKLIPNVKILALDINDKALSLAKKNAQKHNVLEKIEFRNSDLLSKVDNNGFFDICVSNPPYIANDYDLPQNVKFEPSNALFGGEIGDELLQKIITQTNNKNIKYLACEMGYDQKIAITSFVEKNISKKELQFYKDYCNFDRGFILKY